MNCVKYFGEVSGHFEGVSLQDYNIGQKGKKTFFMLPIPLIFNVEDCKKNKKIESQVSLYASHIF